MKNRLRLLALALAASAAATAADVPRPSPEFAFTLPGGKQALLSNYKGKVIALAFISTTCPHCQHLTQVMNTLAPEYAAKGVQILEVAMNENAAVLVPPYIQQFQPVYPVGWADLNQILDYLQLSIMKVGYVPKMVFIDRKFVIRGQFEGGDTDFFSNEEKNLRAEFDKLLAETAKKAPARRKVASARRAN